ncbi:MAG: hemolysin family protein [Bacilli bacterium]
MILKILLLFLLIAINGLFSAIEIAFLSLNKIKLKEKIDEGSKKAMKVQKLSMNPSRFLATIQVVITFGGFMASAIAASSFTDQILLYLTINSAYKGLVETIILIVITVLLSYLTLVFGELLPKKIALSNPNKFAIDTVNVLDFSLKVFYPFVYILTNSVKLLQNLFKIKEPKEDKLTENTIKKIISYSKNEGILEKEESNIILNVFKFNDITVSNVMTPIKEVMSINYEDSPKEVIDQIRRTKHTRFPVFDGKDIIGILNIKDLIVIKKDDFNKNDLMRLPIFVKEDDKIDDIFNKMKEKNVGLMIVKNDKKVTGIITMEDIIEELLGNIYDEYN